MDEGPRRLAKIASIAVSAAVAIGPGCSFVLDWDIKPDAGLDPAACALLEPNDSIAAAMPIAAGATGPAAICVAGDLDYYRFSVVDGQSVTITVSFDISNTQDLDIFVYDGGGTLISSGVTFGPSQEVVACPGTNPLCPSLPTGDYYFLVEGGSPTVRNLYDITLAITP